MDPAVVAAVLDDHRTAPVEPRLRAMLDYLAKVTLEPDAVGPDDLAPLRAEGLSDEAIVDAVHICAAFNLYDRLADALGWQVPPDASFVRQGRMLLRRGYRE